MNQDVHEPEEHVAPSDAFRDATSKFAELRAYAQQYFAAKVDLAKLSARNIAIMAVLGVVGLLALASIVVISLVLLLSGIAGGIGAALGGRMWAGDLLVGGVVVGAVIGGALVGLGIVKKKFMSQAVKKYERIQKQQRDAFARTSRDRTATEGRVEI